MALAEELGFQARLEHTPYIYYHINHISSILYYIIYNCRREGPFSRFMFEALMKEPRWSRSRRFGHLP